MITSNEIKNDVIEIFKTRWQKRDAYKVPTVESVKLGNDAATFNAVVMYADLVESTKLVDSYKDFFAAEIYKSYLTTTCRIIKENGGEIVAFDGDRVMAVFSGETKFTSAIKASLKINYAVNEIINPLIIQQYPNTAYKIRQVIGIDASDLFVAKTGIWGYNDLVWVGRAANYAAKLCSINEEGYSTYITKTVFDALPHSDKYGGSPPQLMWEERNWAKMNITIYRSGWHWKF